MEKMSPILVRLKALISEIDSLSHVESHISVVKSSLESSIKTLEKLEHELKIGEEAVDKLENTSLNSLFRQVLGDKEKQLDKKRQAYLEASLKFNEAKSSAELLEFEQAVLEKKLSKLPSLQAELEDLKKAREKEILKVGGPLIQGRLRELLKKAEATILLENECKEAIQAGMQAKEDVHFILTHLQKAKEWGQWDMVNRGRQYKRSKFNAIDRARSHVHSAQHRLNIYRQELRDVGINEQGLAIDTASFQGFSNVFFSNIISDWLIQQRIVKSLNSVNETYQLLNQVQIYLTNEWSKTKDEYARLMIAKDELLYADND